MANGYTPLLLCSGDSGGDRWGDRRGGLVPRLRGADKCSSAPVQPSGGALRSRKASGGCFWALASLNDESHDHVSPDLSACLSSVVDGLMLVLGRVLGDFCDGILSEVAPRKGRCHAFEPGGRGGRRSGHSFAVLSSRVFVAPMRVVSSAGVR